MPKSHAYLQTMTKEPAKFQIDQYKSHAYLQTMTKEPAKFQIDQYKTQGTYCHLSKAKVKEGE